MTSEEKLAELRGRFPKLLPGSGRLRSLDIGLGWHRIVEGLLEDIQVEYDKLSPELQDGIYVVQVKEKFGSLRFYMNDETPIMSELIRDAEALSSSICEGCGDRGHSVSPRGWMKTLCDECEAVDIARK